MNQFKTKQQQICELASKFLVSFKQFHKNQKAIQDCLMLSATQQQQQIQTLKHEHEHEHEHKHYNEDNHDKHPTQDKHPAQDKHPCQNKSSIKHQNNPNKHISAQDIKIKQSQKSKKYRVYELQYKKQIVQQIQKQARQNPCRSLHSIMRQKSQIHGIHIKNLSRWTKLKEIRPRQGGRKPMYPEIEGMLASFAKENPNYKRRQLINKAKQYSRQLGLDVHETGFRFSKGWYQRFRQRNMKQKNRSIKNQEQQQVKKEQEEQEEQEKQEKQEEQEKQDEQENEQDQQRHTIKSEINNIILKMPQK